MIAIRFLFFGYLSHYIHLRSSTSTIFYTSTYSSALSAKAELSTSSNLATSHTWAKWKRASSNFSNFGRFGYFSYSTYLSLLNILIIFILEAFKTYRFSVVLCLADSEEINETLVNFNFAFEHALDCALQGFLHYWVIVILARVTTVSIAVVWRGLLNKSLAYLFGE